VHRLVLAAFVRPPGRGEQACHRNGDPSDNRLSNLYWGSQGANWSDRLRHGNGRAWSKLSEVDVSAIRERGARGEPVSAIARDFPVSDTQIRNVLTERQWSNPEPDPAVVQPARSVLGSVWLGVSVENQQWADIRIPALLDTPAAVRWISAEPLLGPVVLADGWLTRLRAVRPGLDWVVVGGESGRIARPMHPDWARGLRDQCAAASVPFFFKQHGEWAPIGPLYAQGDDEQEADDARMDAVAWEIEERREVVQLERTGHVARDHQPGDPRTWLMVRAGKKAAGRVLDGRTWDEYPG